MSVLRTIELSVKATAVPGRLERKVVRRQHIHNHRRLIPCRCSKQALQITARPLDAGVHGTAEKKWTVGELARLGKTRIASLWAQKEPSSCMSIDQ